MEIFASTSLFDFQDKFKTNNDCKEYLYHFKWKDGFKCTKCGHTESWSGYRPYTKVCKKCRKIHSATSNTIFHNIKFPLLKAFYIVFEIASSTKSLSSSQISRRYDINKDTAWLFMRKYRESLKSSGNYPIENKKDTVIYVDEFVIGGYEPDKVGRSSDSKKRKILMVVEATNLNKIKRAYGMKIQNYSGRELSKIFERHITEGASVITDGWRGYNNIKGYNIYKNVEVMKKMINPMNRVMQQFKSWVRGIHHHVSNEHIQGYINEFCFRLNRSQWKTTTFHSAILKAINHPPYPKKEILDMNFSV
jgi:hypothetical protein